MGIPILIRGLILMMTRGSNDEGLTRGELHYIHGPTISGRPPTLEMERAPNDESRGLSGEMRTGTRASISIGGKQEKQQTSSRPQATSLRGTSKTSTWALSMAYKKNDKEFIHILEGSVTVDVTIVSKTYSWVHASLLLTLRLDIRSSFYSVVFFQSPGRCLGA